MSTGCWRNATAAFRRAGRPHVRRVLAEPKFANPLPISPSPICRHRRPLPTSGRHLVYLDVWNREVTHLEQPGPRRDRRRRRDDLAHPDGVAGARARTDAGASATCARPTATAGLGRRDRALDRQAHDRHLRRRAPATDPCELPPTGGYRGLENQLYRVEIHDPGPPGGRRTFKWSRDNASVGSARRQHRVRHRAGARTRSGATTCCVQDRRLGGDH